MRGRCVILLWLAIASAPAAADEDAPALGARDLNHGYGQLYDAASGLRHTGKLLLIKRESDAVEAVIEDLSKSMDQIAEGLEALAEADPDLKLDDDGLPPIERRKRKAVERDRLHSFKPFTGRTGRNFERTLLLSNSGALHQLIFLTLELDNADSDERRSRFLKDTRRTLERLYGEVVRLLERDYFR